jgi:hypothetical protein
MRIDRKKLTLVIASLCGASSSGVTVGQEGHSFASPASSVGRIGDSGEHDDSDNSYSSSTRPAAFRANAAPESYYAPDAAASYTAPSADASYTLSTSCSTGACGLPVVSSRRASTCSSLGWLESETLLWWGKGMQSAPLVVGGPAGTTPTQVLAGGLDNRLGTDLLVGSRVNLGLWLDDCQSTGVGARAFGILSDASTQRYAGPGETAIPLFDTFLGQPALYRVNQTNVNGANVGTIDVTNDLDLIAGELYGKALLAQDSNSRVDLLGGYTFLRLDTELAIASAIVDGITGNGIQNGQLTQRADSFGTKNIFHGGHIGLSHELKKGRFTFSSLGKVAIGNMQQSSNVVGASSATNTGSPFTSNTGLFAQGGNSGRISRDVFTFIPEAGAKMKYQLGRAQLGVGYTLLMLPNVALAADQMDTNVDFPAILLNSAATPPSPRFSTDTFFLHGLDLGVTFQF